MTNPDIQVKNSGIVPRLLIDEGARGALRVVENEKLPFKMERVYTMSGIQGEDRGGHAHKATSQAIFVIRGPFTLHLDDGKMTQSFSLTDQMDGILLGPMLWHSMSDFTPDCVALVVSSAPYDEADYIRDYEEFKRAI